MLRILNCGAGVQSSTILLMSLHGELPRPDHAIFADTGDEPEDVYAWAKELKKLAEKAGITWHEVTRGYSILEHMEERIPAGRRLDNIPAYSESESGAPSPIGRSCTREWKIKPIDRKVKDLLGIGRHGHWPKELSVETWLGISGDEMQRMKASVVPWQRFWHPLIEHEFDGPTARMRYPSITRDDCLSWMRSHGYPEPPRSACVYCPFHSNAEWRRIRSMPREWAKANHADQLLRSGPGGFVHGMNAPVYLHRSLVPLADAPIDGIAGQSSFLEECAGICGV